MVDAAGARQTIGSACIGTVRGDMHDIGKNLVKIMLEGSNIQVYDLGADVPPEEFIHAAREHHCDIIACSALLTTTMQQMRQVVDLARKPASGIGCALWWAVRPSARASAMRSMRISTLLTLPPPPGPP